MAPLKTQKQKGGLKVSGIGLVFEKGKLGIHLDASLLVGPIGAGLKGLTISFDLSKIGGLHDLLKCPVDVSMDGFDMSFDKDPTAEMEQFSGGVTVSLKTFSIAALGQYAQVAEVPQVHPAYDSFFVYAMMEGTLFTVGWADVPGLIAGFGYNSKLRLPAGRVSGSDSKDSAAAADEGGAVQAGKDTWVVRGDALHFQVRSPVPISSGAVDGIDGNNGGKGAARGSTILSRPMQVRDGDGRDLRSNLQVSAHAVINGQAADPIPFRLAEEIWDHVPNDYLDPGRSAPTTHHLVGLSVLPPPAKAAGHQVPLKPIPPETHTSSGYEVVPWQFRMPERCAV
ncbi:hypothetical protein B0T24DRAFT_671514 [Lasiosphaeria ovina]|uniref:DUF6603 domain-containing protein n=1 Tax=Lasiosphaeria ovina TaxID=92902 RepID=A0AAE0JUA9_9PEZI|nr:hypothetical protein B0T24DRAFT_671514 [Lasiosphaeria ovina]